MQEGSGMEQYHNAPNIQVEVSSDRRRETAIVSCDPQITRKDGSSSKFTCLKERWALNLAYQISWKLQMQRQYVKRK